MKPTTKQLFTRLFILVLSFLCSMGLFTLVYRLDNKYRLQTPQPINGILFYEPEQFPVVYLINGWEYYRQKLLTPEDFQEDAPLPDDYIFIGQYGGMEAGMRTPPLMGVPPTAFFCPCRTHLPPIHWSSRKSTRPTVCTSTAG